MAVLEDLDGCALGKVVLNSMCKLYGAVVQIVVAHEAAGKADKDVGRRGRGMGGDGSVCGSGVEQGRGRGQGCDQGCG